jgi:hypothetical protein
VYLGHNYTFDAACHYTVGDDVLVNIIGLVHLKRTK